MCFRAPNLLKRIVICAVPWGKVTLRQQLHLSLKAPTFFTTHRRTEAAWDIGFKECRVPLPLVIAMLSTRDLWRCGNRDA